MFIDLGPESWSAWCEGLLARREAFTEAAEDRRSLGGFATALDSTKIAVLEVMW